MQFRATFAFLAITIFTNPCARAQDVQVQPEVFPPEFRGMVVYDGVVNGTAVIPPQGRMELSLGGLLNQALNTRTVKLQGTWHVEAEYEGSTVRGRSVVDSSIDGLSENVEFVGTRQGNNCQISFADQPAMPITCSPLLFESNVNYTNENRQKIKARYLASKSKIVDYVERDRLLALAAAEEAKRAAIAAAAAPDFREMPINASQAGSYKAIASKIIDNDSTHWSVNKFISGTIRNVRYFVDQKNRLNSKIKVDYDFDGIFGESTGWLELNFEGKLLKCIEFHDSSCREPRKNRYAARITELSLIKKRLGAMPVPSNECFSEITYSRPGRTIQKYNGQFSVHGGVDIENVYVPGEQYSETYYKCDPVSYKLQCADDSGDSNIDLQPGKTTIGRGYIIDHNEKIKSGFCVRTN